MGDWQKDIKIWREKEEDHIIIFFFWFSEEQGINFFHF